MAETAVTTAMATEATAAAAAMAAAATEQTAAVAAAAASANTFVISIGWACSSVLEGNYPKAT